MFKFIRLFFLIAISLIAVASTPAQKSERSSSRQNLKSGAVYVMTNQVVNSVIAFSRDPKTGSLTVVDTEPTGGTGNPTALPGDPATDPLASQGALAVDEGNEYLYAVNAGSNEISVLKISRDKLEFVQKIASGGIRPISLTINGGLLYVLNEGGNPNISGFSVAGDGTLTPIADSTQLLVGGPAADPAQVGFNSSGTLLVVSEKAGNRLDTYVIDQYGVAGPPNANSSSGATPFGFASGGDDFLFVSEARSGSPLASSVSSYNADGPTLDLVSSSTPNGQTASCWLATTSDGKYSFTSNTATATVSSYESDQSGVLHLIEGAAASTGAGTFPIDLSLSSNDRFLYVLENGSHAVSGWAIAKDGSLIPIGRFGTLPSGAQGIAAK
jgi:6-phosphogluconolactonase (cycloisomerase 2 family)